MSRENLKIRKLNKNNPPKKRGLWYNMWKKKYSGKRMRKAGEKGAPTKEAIKKSQGD